MLKPFASSTEFILKHRKRLIPVCLCLISFGLSGLGAWRGLDRVAADALIRWRINTAPLPLSPRIIPVDLNDRAERNLGDQIDSRQAFVDLFQILGEGQLAGGMDFLFQGRKDTEIDQAMAQAIQEMNSLVLAVVPVSAEVSYFSGEGLAPEDEAIVRDRLWRPKVIDAGSIPFATTFLIPNSTLLRSSGLLGHIGVEPDSDGLYRRVPLLYRWEDGYMPSLALALAAADLDIEPTTIVIKAGSSITLTKPNGHAIHIPIDKQGRALIPFPSLWSQGWKRIPLDKVVAAAMDENERANIIDQWTDGIVIAADITTAHKDFGTNPLETVYPLSGIHTSILNGILTDTFYLDLKLPYRFIIGLTLLIVIAFLTGIPREPVVHIGFAVAGITVSVLMIMLWFGFLVEPWIAAPLLGLLFAWIGAYIQQVLLRHEQQLLLENALTRYFPKALAARILKEKKTDLRPASKELTILFADIAGFTKWSSDKTPEIVHSFLSDYLESMAGILFAHGGTVDKFMGDGILAFFGDPWDQPDHTQRCAEAAIDMQEKVVALRKKWEPVIGIDLKIRIGINTGSVIVGNLGTTTRIEYTVIGAAVNLAQRMESNAPVGGILVAEDAWIRVSTRFFFGDLLKITVKGYQEPIVAYELKLLQRGENQS